MVDEVIKKQELIDAQKDAQSLDDFINGSDEQIVVTRLLKEYPTLANAIRQIYEKGGKFYPTLAAANADIANIRTDVYVITGDNGAYYKATAGATTLTKSTYDPLTQAKAYTDSETKITFQNKLINGDFTNGVTSWGYQNSTIANVSSDLEITLTGALFNGFARQTAIPTTVGNKYLLKARFKVDNSVCQKVEIGSSSNFGTDGYITVNNPTADEWIEVSEIRTAAATTSIFYLIHAYADAATAANKKLTVDYVSVIDLTESFPDGIPKQDVLDKIFTNKPAPYSLTAKDLLNENLYLNYVTTDQVALITEQDRLKNGSVELFKEQSVVLGAVFADGGIGTTPTSYRYTGFLDVSKFGKLQLSGFTQNFTYAFYDADKKPVAVYPPTNTNYVLNGYIDVPQDSVYFARSLRTATQEVYTDLSILGIYAKDRLSALANTDDVLGLSDVDVGEIVRVDLMTALTKMQGEVTATGIINDTSEYQFSGYLDVSDYYGVSLIGFRADAASLKTRFWFDENKALIQKFEYSTDPSNYTINGFLWKPKGAKYFAANTKNPTNEETLAAIKGERKLNSSDFQRKGSSGDASQGWEITTSEAKTQKKVEVFSELYPEVKPVRIVNYGKQIGYDYGARINFDTEIYRLGWGMQMSMNLPKPNAPEDIYAVKNIKSENGLIFEFGVEGFSWHVCPPNADYLQKNWMMFKLGGHSPRSNTNYSFKNASVAQLFAPLWQERTDKGAGQGWVEVSANGVVDDTVPTQTMLRQSLTFESPEFYRAGYSNTANLAQWDRYVRTRGSYGAPTAAQHGDSIHKQVYSVATGADANNNPILKDVAQIEIVYNDDANPESAKIVFKVWNKVTESWEEKLVL